jgi:hypothetical protein
MSRAYGEDVTSEIDTEDRRRNCASRQKLFLMNYTEDLRRRCYVGDGITLHRRLFLIYVENSRRHDTSDNLCRTFTSKVIRTFTEGHNQTENIYQTSWVIYMEGKYLPDILGHIYEEYNAYRSFRKHS